MSWIFGCRRVTKKKMKKKIERRSRDKRIEEVKQNKVRCCLLCRSARVSFFCFNLIFFSLKLSRVLHKMDLSYGYSLVVRILCYGRGDLGLNPNSPILVIVFKFRVTMFEKLKNRQFTIYTVFNDSSGF